MILQKYGIRLIVSFMVPALLIAGVFFVSKNYNSSSFLGEPIFTGVEIAEKTAYFLDKTINDDGSFNLMYECNEINSDCIIIDAPGPVHTGQVLRAYFHLWKITGEQKYKEKADRAMQFVLDACVKDLSYCEWNYFALHDFYMDSDDNRYKEAMLKSADKFLNASLKDTIDNNNGIKLGALYHITGEKKYLDKLDKTAKEILNRKFSRGSVFFKNNDYVVKNNDIHIIWSIYLPAYIATENLVYLDTIKDFFNNADITKHLNEFKSDAGLGIGNLTKAWEVLLDLSEIAQGRNPQHSDISGMNLVPIALAAHDEPGDDPEIFYRQAKIIAQSILNTRWDLPEKKRFNADYGFLHGVKIGKNYKSPFYSGWLVQLYLKMSNEQFELITDE